MRTAEGFLKKFKRKEDRGYRNTVSKSMQRSKSVFSKIMLCLMAFVMLMGNIQFVRAEEVSSIVSGEEYVICSNGYALAVNNNNGLTAVSYEDGQTQITDAMKWVVKQSNGGYTIRSVERNMYLVADVSIWSSDVYLNSNSETWNYDSNEGFYQTTWFQSYYLNRRTGGTPSWEISNSGSNTLYTVETEEPATYYPFSVNLFRYDTAKINDLSPEGLQFNTGESEDPINKWTGWGGGPKTGLVKNSLDDSGNLQFTSDTASILNANTSLDGKETFVNVNLPFKYVDEYYSFDSDDYDVYFAGDQAESNTTLSVNESQKNMSYDHSVSVWNGEKEEVKSGKGFFPFDGEGDLDPTYHFGMTFSTEFFMTENGKINGDADGEPITFEFSGDDDVWVFVDEKLVLDLGGIHDKISGSIDFANGVSKISYVNMDNGDESSSDNNLWDLLGTTEEAWRGTSEPHTLQVFYLERGKGASNCKIRFNLPQKNCIEVTKRLGNDDVDSDELAALLQNRYSFTAYTKEEGSDNEYTPYVGVYYLYGATGSLIGAYRTDDQGKFVLGFNQTARFYLDDDIYENAASRIYIEEMDAENSEKEWIASINGGSEQIETGSTSPELTIEKMEDMRVNAMTRYSFVCTNTVSASANDDIVVLDYGKPVKINVLSNDTLFGENRTIGGIKTLSENVFNFSIQLENGNAAVESDEVVYTPTTFMDSIDKFEYRIGDGTVDDESNIAEVSVIPASNVYYEDNFTIDNSENTQIKYTGNYVTIQDGTPADQYQSSENVVYGSDVAYSNQNKYSDGSAHKMEVGATAEFTFKGTGVDIYTQTDNSSPIVMAWLYKVNEDSSQTLKKAVMVDNKYDIENKTLYQIPTICFDTDEYGTYKVELQVASAGGENSSYYLDAIRIYNPIDPGSSDAEEANDAYAQAGEANPIVQEVRDLLINAEDLTGGNGEVNGIVYLDNMPDGTDSIDDYEKDGPKNEVYLSKDNAIAFTLDGYDPTQRVYLGVKSPEGSEGNVTITDGTTVKSVAINSASDMYIPITPDDNGNIVIENTRDSLISITKIRVTNTSGSISHEQNLSIVVNENTLQYTDEFVSIVNAVNEDDSSLPDDDVQTPGIDDSPNDDGHSNPVVDFIQSIISGLKNLFRW